MTERTTTAQNDRVKKVEWPTLSLIVACYAIWLGAVFWLSAFLPVGAVVISGVMIAFHGSLTHEAIHGHPFRQQFANEMLMRLPIGLAVPYCRFRDLHLAHHRDANLTDPYDDPETNYLDPDVWAKMPAWKRAVFKVNNTLVGRILVGPALGMVMFWRAEWLLARQGDRMIWLAWALHLLGCITVIWLVAMSPMSLGLYCMACYVALGLLRIRTFLEHQAHEKVRGRTVIIEDRGPLALLFLNNNLHVVHHMHPGVPWYQLPRLYDGAKERFLAINQGYFYRSYVQIFLKYFFRPKDPVAHPLWRKF